MTSIAPTTIALLVTALLITACGGAASDLTPETAQAERAYAAGRYVEAAARFADAARMSPRARDREEARYRQAVSLERAGRLDDARAAFELLEHEYPKGARAPRAAYDVALLDIDAGRADGGYRELDALVRQHPESGLAPPALRRYLGSLDGSGELAVQAYLTALAPTVARTELSQYVDYELARSLERAGEPARAREAYLALADRYPYPRGVFWDDALYRAADLAAAGGDAQAAIALLERLLAAREPSFGQGSYERGRYADAAFRIAELYRDALDDPGRARRAFERMWTAYPTSRLRDDAAWCAALLAAAARDTAGACQDVKPLLIANPPSRYAACAPHLCPAVTAPPGAGRCHEYLLRPR